MRAFPRQHVKCRMEWLKDAHPAEYDAKMAEKAERKERKARLKAERQQAVHKEGKPATRKQRQPVEADHVELPVSVSLLL